MGISVTDNPYRTEHIDITMLEQSNLQDVGAFLRGIPNVNGIRKGALGIDPVIRGFKYSQLNVQVNGGTRIEGGCPNRMDPATAHVDLSDLKDINIIKGQYYMFRMIQINYKIAIQISNDPNITIGILYLYILDGLIGNFINYLTCNAY